MIVHIPHDSDYIPQHRSDFIGEPISIRDVGARYLYESKSYNTLVFDVSRLVCDVERLEEGEPMDSCGMGICYERNANGEPLREVTDEYRSEVIEEYYKPHHDKLEALVGSEISKYGHSIIIDGHTFSPIPLPYESDKLRPDVCVGYDDSDSELGTFVAGLFRQKGYDVAENRPFSGSMKPLRYIDDKRVSSVMIETRADLVSEGMRADIQDILGVIATV